MNTNKPTAIIEPDTVATACKVFWRHFANEELHAVPALLQQAMQAAILHAVTPATAAEGMALCTKCSWGGNASATLMRGQEGPLCPECYSQVFTSQPDQASSAELTVDMGDVEEPRDADHAECMVQMGMLYLHEHAPERIELPPEAAPSPQTPDMEALKALIDKWRTEADRRIPSDGGGTFDDCANELEAVVGQNFNRFADTEDAQ